MSCCELFDSIWFKIYFIISACCTYIVILELLRRFFLWLNKVLATSDHKSVKFWIITGISAAIGSVLGAWVGHLI